MPSDRSHGLSEPVLALRAAARPRPAVRDRRGRRHRSAAPLPTAAPAGWRNTSIPATRPIRLTMNGRDYGCRHRAGAVPRREDGELNSARTLRCRSRTRRCRCSCSAPNELGARRDSRASSTPGSRISLFIGFGGVFVSFSPRGDPETTGMRLRLLRSWSRRGRRSDPAHHRGDAAEHVQNIPLWIALSAALPHDWGILKIYFAITLILALSLHRGWTGLRAGHTQCAAS